MSWVQSKSSLIKAALGAALVCGFASAAPSTAQQTKRALIVKSTASEYKIGTRISEDDEITLQNGDVVTVLTSRGSRIMRGPGVFVVGANPKANRARVANLTRARAAQAQGTASVRSALTDGDEDRPLNPNLYYLDVDKSGPVCLRDLSEVNLWRPYSAEAVTYSLSEAGGDETSQVLSLTIPFAKRENFALVKGDRFAVKDGASYTISGPQTGTVTSITVIDLGSDIKVADELAEVLYQKGCLAQLELMAERLAPQ